MNQFTLKFYKQLVLETDKTLRVMDWILEKPQTGLILRHDVDLSLSLAYEFSRKELEINAVSTYYVLTTTDLYNPFSRINRVLLQKMCADGFEIGLHFDPRTYNLQEDLKLVLIREWKQLQDILGKPVVSYSFHNPGMLGETKLCEIDGLIRAYDSRIFNDKCYISDSLFSFRGKDPREWIKRSKSQIIQFLTHPFQYFRGSNE